MWLWWGRRVGTGHCRSGGRAHSCRPRGMAVGVQGTKQRTRDQQGRETRAWPHPWHQHPGVSSGSSWAAEARHGHRAAVGQGTLAG